MKRRVVEERREKCGRTGAGGDDANPWNMSICKYRQVCEEVHGIEEK